MSVWVRVTFKTSLSMLFLRREVVSASGNPLPLPERAQAPKKGTDDELKTLPNPYLIGTQSPPAAAAAK
jgi:hypothetical protein